MRTRTYPWGMGAERYPALEWSDSELAGGTLEGKAGRDSLEYNRWVQAALNRIMGLRLAVDGILGLATRSAIRSFQQQNRLAVDGVVGPQTKRALMATGAGQPPRVVTVPRTRPDWIEWVPSPNFRGRYGRRSTSAVSAIIYHYTAGPNLKIAIDTLKERGGNSAHYVIGLDGRVVQMVELEEVAFHAGESILYNRRNVNGFSVGIEIVNWGPVLARREQNCTYPFCTPYGRKYVGLSPVRIGKHYWQPYTDQQYQALIRLTRYLISIIPTINVIAGHEDIAPTRKIDPGPAFDWDRIRAGLAPGFRGHVGPLPR